MNRSQYNTQDIQNLKTLREVAKEEINEKLPEILHIYEGKPRISLAGVTAACGYKFRADEHNCPNNKCGHPICPVCEAILILKDT